MRDHPGLQGSKQIQAHQIFESAALAVAGTQSGAFYGSVRWGWQKPAGVDHPTLIPFQLLRPATPSSDFSDATILWNASKTSRDEASIALPIVSEMFTNSKKTELLDSPDKGKSVVLEMNTRVETTTQTAKDLRKVIVISGKFVGRVGFVKQANLSTNPTETKKSR